MSEVAYKSFIQLTTGPNPLLRIFPPKSKPRTRAAAVSEEGYAYKDYIVQVTEHGFDFMRVKPVYDDAGSPPRKARKITHDQLGLMSPTDMGIPGSGHSKFGPNLALIPLISEQEQEVATNMLLYFKASIDGLLATIVHLRSENQNLQKENMTLAMLNNTLNSDYEAHKSQLIKITQFIQQQQQQDLQAGMMQQSQQSLIDQQNILLQEQQQHQLMQQQQQGLQIHDQYQHDQLQQHLQQLQQQQLQQQQLQQQQQQLHQQQLQQQQLQQQQQEFGSYPTYAHT